MVRPLLDTLIDNHGSFVADYVLRFEQLDQDYARLCDVLGNEDSSLNHVNKTKHKNESVFYADYYDEKSRKIVGDLFRRDIEYFGYTFGK